MSEEMPSPPDEANRIVETCPLLRQKISKSGKHTKYLPYVFTEQGVAILSSILKSARAIQVNIAIMRAFVKLKQILSMNKELAYKLIEFERKIEKHDVEIQAIFEVIRKLMAPAPIKQKPQICFKPDPNWKSS